MKMIVKTERSYSIFISCFNLPSLLAFVYVNKETVHIQKEERRKSDNCVHSSPTCTPQSSQTVLIRD